MRRLLLAATIIAIAPVPSSRLHAQQPQTRPGSSIDHPIRISGGVLAGQLQNKVNPTYPPEAKAKGISGFVVFTVTIDPQGAIVKQAVLSGPQALRDAASTALAQWTYKPYLLNGDPVFVLSTVTMNFQLQP